MELAVISDPEILNGEENFISLLFDEGLKYFHLRKPDCTIGKLKEFLYKIPIQHHHKIVIHGYWDLMEEFNLAGVHIREKDKNHSEDKKLKFHSIATHEFEELYHLDNSYQYALLSPIFNSISKTNVKSTFDFEILKERFAIHKPRVPVYALGGITPENIHIANEIGFDGIAVLGYLWNTFKTEGAGKALSNFKKLQLLCQ